MRGIALGIFGFQFKFKLNPKDLDPNHPIQIGPYGVNIVSMDEPDNENFQACTKNEVFHILFDLMHAVHNALHAKGGQLPTQMWVEQHFRTVLTVRHL